MRSISDWSRQMKSRTCLGAFVLILALASTADAGPIIVGNTGSATNAGGQVDIDFLLAAGFVSPTDETILASVNATFEAGSGSPSVTLSLFDDASGSPGSLLGTIDTQVVTLQASYLFTASSSMALAAATQYWLVASCSNCVAGTITNNWITSDPITLSGLAGASVTPGIFFKDGADPWGSVPSRTPIFQVNGDSAIAPVPEPASLTLLGLGVAGMGARRWRQRKL